LPSNVSVNPFWVCVTAGALPSVARRFASGISDAGDGCAAETFKEKERTITPPKKAADIRAVLFLFIMTVFP